MATHTTGGHEGEAADDYAGDVTELGDDQRLVCPAEVRRVSGWLARGAPGTLYAELLEDEHVRLWPPETIAKAMSQRKAALESATESEEMLRAFADRYRPIAKQSDARVRFTEAVLFHLGIRPGERPYLYVQGSKHSPAIDVMSLKRRSLILARYRAETAI